MARIPFWLIAVAVALLLAGCGTTHPLPKYEPPLARTTLQTVRTTAYTHTEADHLQYGNRNALGGRLCAAAPPGAVMMANLAPAPAAPVAMPVNGSIVSQRTDGATEGGFQRASYLPPVVTAAPAWTSRQGLAAQQPTAPPVYGSAAADWSRWPAGTVLQILSTGQLYRVDDYGWALSGRNTIDLYLPTRSTMNAWGVRSEPIQILRWGDPDESLRILRPREKYRHIRRMVLELQGNHRAAARLQ